jgi:hypothetical protein
MRDDGGDIAGGDVGIAAGERHAGLLLPLIDH